MVAVLTMLIALALVIFYAVWAWGTTSRVTVRSGDELSSTLLPTIRIAAVSASYDSNSNEANISVIITPTVEANSATVVLSTFSGVTRAVVDGNVTCYDDYCIIYARATVPSGDYRVSVHLPDGRSDEYLYPVRMS
ncbi:MAG: hypothetical protein PWP76_508 [Candidatus Diapherotrites archaeon]|nr:hypothetical protein [Candidatus Diapherotrites archaeon]MDN5367038.1 hypothetical protein [Candidatus Diapherotrites archaeon]